MTQKHTPLEPSQVTRIAKGIRRETLEKLWADPQIRAEFEAWKKGKKT